MIQSAALELATRLEQVRTDFGPIRITSGFRCPVHNTAVGGNRNSQHLLGLAADIACEYDPDRFRLVDSLLRHDFKRIGIGTTSVHADIGNITGPVIWLYP